MVAKLPRGTHSNNGRFSKSDFTIEKDRATCPAGYTTEKIHQARDHKNRKVKKFQLPADVCSNCHKREQCTTAKNGRSITLHYYQGVVYEAAEFNRTDEFKRIYNRRAIVERKLSELLYRHRLRFGRYIGSKKIHLQALWTAAVVNLKKLGKLATELFGTKKLKTQTA